MSRVTSSSSSSSVKVTYPDSNVISTFSAITNVSPAVSTIVTTYTTPTDANFYYLQLISASGQNVSQYQVCINGSPIDQKLTYYTYFNVDFDYRSNSMASPGIFLNSGDIVTLVILQSGTSTANFNARIQVLEMVS